MNIEIKIGSFSKVYAVYETTAPGSYDYEYCIPIYGDDLRLVLIPLESVEYQTQRYASGLYSAKLFDGLTDKQIESEVLRVLYARLTAG